MEKKKERKKERKKEKKKKREPFEISPQAQEQPRLARNNQGEQKEKRYFLRKDQRIWNRKRYEIHQGCVRGGGEQCLHERKGGRGKKGIESFPKDAKDINGGFKT